MATESALKLALQWRRARAKRLEEQKKVDLLEVEERQLKERVMALLKQSKNKAVSNGERLFQITTKDEPIVDDWAKLYKQIQKTGEFEFLFKRINPAAIKERWENGIKVPGVSSIPVDSLSDTTAK